MFNKENKSAFDEISEIVFGESRGTSKETLPLIKMLVRTLLIKVEKEAEENNKTVFDILIDRVDDKVRIVPIDINSFVDIECTLKAENFKGIKPSTVKDYVRYNKTLLRKHTEYHISRYEKHMDDIISELVSNKPYEDMTKDELIAELKKYNK